MKYGTINLGQIEASINKLGGQDVFERLLTCNSVNVTFSDGKAEVVATDPITSVWKTITIGNISQEKFTPTIKERGMNVSEWSVDMMKQDAFTVVSQEEQIDLVVVSVRDLGFDKTTRYDAICARAKERGLELCPAEVGPQLRLQYLDQPLGEWIRVAMEAIRDSDGDLEVFGVGHYGDGLWLGSLYGRPGSLWSPDDRFVFRARKEFGSSDTLSSETYKPGLLERVKNLEDRVTKLEKII